MRRERDYLIRFYGFRWTSSRTKVLIPTSFITLRRERDYLILFTDFDGLRLEPRFSSLLPSLHCGESGIISSVLRISMDFVSNQGSHPYFLHYIAERAGLSHPFYGFRWTSSRTKVLIPTSFITLRRERDSNPRYGYPYVSLANWWF